MLLVCFFHLKIDLIQRLCKQSHEYDFDELERQQYEKQQQKLEAIRKDKEHQKWLESEWYVKYPNMRI